MEAEMVAEMVADPDASTRRYLHHCHLHCRSSVSADVLVIMVLIYQVQSLGVLFDYLIFVSKSARMQVEMTRTNNSIN